MYSASVYNSLFNPFPPPVSRPLTPSLPLLDIPLLAQSFSLSISTCESQQRRQTEIGVLLSM